MRTEKGDDSKELKASLRGLYKTWLKPVEDYEFPMVTLAEDTSASAVCTIFETLNRTGVKLSVFDLLTARFWPADVKLRDLWERAQDDSPIIADFGIDPYYILQAVSIFATDAAPSCKRSDVLKLSVDQIGRGWAPVVAGLAEALTVLKNDCGVLLPQFLPYYTMLVPSSAALAAMQGTSGPGVGIYKSRFNRWLWCSVFGQAYENAPNSQSSKDSLALTRWMRVAPDPHTTPPAPAALVPSLETN